MELDNGVTAVPAAETIVEPAAGPAAAAPRKPRKALRVVAVLLAIALVAAAGILGAGQLSRTNRARTDLNGAIERLSAVEPAVLQVDGAVRSEIASSVVPAATDALEAAGGASTRLKEAVELLDSAAPGLSKSDAALAAAVRDAVTARQTMLEEAATVLEADIRAGGVLDPAHSAWTLASEAGTLTLNAATEYNKHTKAGVTASTKLSNQATEKLKAARSLLETVTAGFPEAKMEAYTSYISARLALLDSSRKIDSTWLAGKIDDANKLLDAYNAQEAKVVSQAKVLKTTPAGELANAYEALTKDAITRYFDARDDAREADDRVKAAAVE